MALAWPKQLSCNPKQGYFHSHKYTMKDSSIPQLQTRNSVSELETHSDIKRNLTPLPTKHRESNSPKSWKKTQPTTWENPEIPERERKTGKESLCVRCTAVERTRICSQRVLSHSWRGTKCPRETKFVQNLCMRNQQTQNRGE